MKPADPTPPTWEAVLASFLAQIDEAQALLDARPAVTDSPVGYDVWHLALPELPDDLRDRARAVYDRQRELAERLQDSMRSIRRQQSLLEDPVPPPRSIFVDQRA